MPGLRYWISDFPLVLDLMTWARKRVILNGVCSWCALTVRNERHSQPPAHAENLRWAYPALKLPPSPGRNLAAQRSQAYSKLMRSTVNLHGLQLHQPRLPWPKLQRAIGATEQDHLMLRYCPGR
jgi:hypothetical protein